MDSKSQHAGMLSLHLEAGSAQVMGTFISTSSKSRSMGSKKSKKDKKEKKEKKSKKSKDTRRDRDRDRRDSRVAEVAMDGLSLLLTWGILHHPRLLTELPAILKSLDDGEYVEISEIRDEGIRAFLEKLMRQLPVLFNAGNGWYKESRETEVTQFVLKRLESNHSIKPGSGLSMSESVASKNVLLKLLVLLEAFPDLKQELGSLLSTLLDGNAVQVDSLDNEDIRDGLEDVFKAMGLERSRDGYGIPDGRKEELVRETLQHLAAVFEVYDAAEKLVQSTEARGSSSRSEPQKTAVEDNDDSSSTSRSSEGGGDADSQISSQSESENEEEARAVGSSSKADDTIEPANRKGPSMPTLEDLRQARALMDQQRQEGDTYGGADQAGQSSDDEEDIGPQMCDPQTARMLQAHASVQPLGFAGGDVAPAFERAFALDILGMHPNGDRYTGEAHPVAEVDKREEWILTPGDSKLAASLSGSGLTNRKFQAGKQAKKLAEQMSIQREFQRQQQKLQAQQEGAERRKHGLNDDGGGGGKEAASEQTTEDLMQEYREKRGVSLMEQHLAKKSKTSHSQEGTGQRRAFDRERDLLSHGRMDEGKVAKLVQNARELDDRFDKAAVQKSFL